MKSSSRIDPHEILCTLSHSHYPLHHMAPHCIPLHPNSSQFIPMHPNASQCTPNASCKLTTCTRKFCSQEVLSRSTACSNTRSSQGRWHDTMQDFFLLEVMQVFLVNSRESLSLDVVETLDFRRMLDDLEHLFNRKGFPCPLASKNDASASAFDLLRCPSHCQSHPSQQTSSSGS